MRSSVNNVSLTREPEVRTDTRDERASASTATSQKAPLRRWARRAIAGDTLAAAIAGASAMAIRFGSADGAEGNISYVVVGVVITVAWPLLLGASGSYELRSSLFGVEELRRILRAALLLLAGTGLAHIALRMNLSRGYFLALLPLVVALTALARAVVRWVTSRGRNDLRSHRVVAVGPAADIEQFCADLVRTGTRTSVDVVAYVADDLDPDAPAPAALAGLRRLPNRTAVRNLADHDVTVDLLVRAGKPGSDEMWFLVQLAHDVGMTVAIAPHREDANTSLAVSYVPLGSTPMLMVETPTLRPAAAIAKAIFDRVMAATLLVVLAPVFAVIAVTIAIRDGRPVFFHQTRVGRDGTEFECWKFRTMCHDAEDQLRRLQHHNEADGLLFKVKDDPRVTPTGRFLRRHSLDELPQFLNVLAGDMSIVGPRPPLPSEVESYDARTNRRLNVKPGITGLWQTQGRSDLPWDDGIYLDLMYIDHWSPLLDLVIMARTVRTVLRPDGAY